MPQRHDLADRLRPLVRWETGLFVALVVIVFIGTQASDQFLTKGNLFNLCISIGEVAIMTLPLTLIVITGEIDLSVASILGLASAMLGYLVSHGWPMITRLGLPALAVTIGTLTLYRGLAVVILGPNIVSKFPERYTNIGVNGFAGTFLSWSVVFFLVLALIFGVLLHLTPLGRSLFVMGANKDAALYAGFRVRRIKFLLFVLSGVICALAGILYTFQLSTAVQDNGLGLELNVEALETTAELARIRATWLGRWDLTG